MARFARAGHRAVIHTRSRPGKGGVAVVAGIAAHDVACMLTGCDASVVAAPALNRRTFKHTFYMAGFTCRTHVLATERKAGAEMVEARVDLGRREGAREPCQHAHKNQ